MNKRSIIFLAILVVFFAGIGLFTFTNSSNITAILLNKVPDEQEIIAIDSLKAIENNDYDEMISYYSSEVTGNETITAQMRELVSSYNFGRQVNNELIEYSKRNVNGFKVDIVVYEIEYEDLWVIYTAQIVDENGQYKMTHIRLDPYTDSLHNLNRLTLKGKGLGHYIIILLSIGVLGFTLYSSAICFGSDRKHRVWFALLILVGIGELTFGWTRGFQLFNATTIGFPMVSLGRSGSVGEFILKLRVPLVAIIFWIDKRRLDSKKAMREKEEKAKSAEPASLDQAPVELSAGEEQLKLKKEAEED